MNTAIKLTILFCCCAFVVFASPPNKEKMQPCKIRFQNLQAAKDYTFYWRDDHGNFTHFFTKDSSFVIPADDKRPDGGYFWGINSITKKSTNIIEFRNNYSPDLLIIINAIINDSIFYDKKEIANANVLNQIDNTKPEASPSTKETKLQTSTILFIVASIIAAVTIFLILFRRNKKKRQQA